MNYQKAHVIRSQAIRESARGQECTMQTPVCTHDRATVVWAHSNMQLHGKGVGRKADDIFGCYACSACHDWYDSSFASRDEKERVFYAAFSRSLRILIDSGVVSVEA